MPFSSTPSKVRFVPEMPQVRRSLVIHPVEPRNGLGTNATFKQRIKPEYPAAHLVQELADDPVIEHSIWQEEEVPEPAEGQSLRVLMVEIPPPILRRSLSGDDDWDCSRAVPQLRAEWNAIRKQVAKKFGALDELPVRGVDKRKYIQLWLAIRDTSF